MNIAERDRVIMKLNEQLNVLSNYKLKRVKELQEKIHDNTLLNTVIDNYKKYDYELMHLKKQQAEHIENLILYLEKSMAEAGVTEHMIQQATREKQNLTKQIKTIHKELNDLI